MAEIDGYVEALFLREGAAYLALGDASRRRSEMVDIIRVAVDDLLMKYSAAGVTDTLEVAERIFSKIEEAKAVILTVDPIAGAYYRLTQPLFYTARAKIADGNAIIERAERIGSRFFPDVFDAYLGRVGGDDFVDRAIGVPAADRIVTLTHNQVDELEEPIAELVTQLERDNGLPDHPGMKERLLGQIKAGRELLRAGNFRLYLLHVTLLRALGELMERYKGSAIAMVAASLVDLLVKSALKAS